MTLLPLNVLLFSAQAAVLIALGALVLGVTRVPSPRVRFVALRLLLACALLWPPLAPRTVAVSTETGGTALIAAGSTASGQRDTGGAGGSMAPWMTVAVVGWLLGMAARTTAMVVGVRRLRRWAAEGRPVSGDEDLRAALGRGADVRYVEALHHPVTFGWWRPRVLLPPVLERQSDAVRRAILCHELLHVERRDWLWLVVEEVVRTALWFHPAFWWLVARIQAVREELVDRLVIGRLGNRRAYIDALLAFGDTTPFRPAPAFGTRHQLVHRIRRIAKEVEMSPLRVALSCALFVVVVGMGGWYGVHALPLQSSGSRDAGPLERQARPITPENPVPRRTASALPPYPAALLATKLDLILTLQITIDAGGRVAEHRVVSMQGSAIDGDADARTIADAAALLDAAVTSALKQWLYDPPFEAPMTFPVSLRFIPVRPGGTVVELTTPLSTTTAPTWHGGALNVGNGVAPPKKIKDVRPIYPEDAKAANIAGIVILEIRIEADGRVSQARVLRSIPALDQAALDAVAQWGFEPPAKDGAPTAALMIVTVNFTRN